MKVRSFFALLLAVLLATLLPVSAAAAVDLNDPQYVTDDADVLSAALEEKILAANEELWNDCSGAELVVVTVAYPPAGMDREEYAVKIFDSWKIGSADSDNGMLLVLYTEADDFWLECGRGIYGSPYVDELASLVGDDSDFYKAILADRDEEAVSLLLDGAMKWFRTHYRSSAGGAAPSYGYGQNAPYAYEDDGESLLTLLLLILLIVVITSPVRCRRRWGHWGIWPFFYLSPWWRTRRRITPSPTNGRGVWGYDPGMSQVRRRPTTYYHSGSSTRSGSYGRSGGGFGGSSGRTSFGGRSGGFSGRPGGGGHSGGGFGHR